MGTRRHNLIKARNRQGTAYHTNLEASPFPPCVSGDVRILGAFPDRIWVISALVILSEGGDRFGVDALCVKCFKGFEREQFISA